MQKFVEFMEKNAKKIIVIIIIANILAFFGLLRIRINPDYTTFMPKHSIQIDLYNKVLEKFKAQDQITLVLEFNKNPVNIENLNFLKKLELDFEKIKGVKTVIGPVPKLVPVGFLKIQKVTKVDQSNFQKIIDFLKGYSDFMNPIAEKDGKYYCLFNIFPDPNAEIRPIIKSLEKTLKDKNVRYYMSGNLYIQEKLFDYIFSILLTLPPLAIIIMFFVFRWRIGSKKATFLSVIPAGFGALWTLGIMGWTIREISMITVLVPIFTIIMGSADGLHFMSHFLDEMEKDNDIKKALTKTLSVIGIALIMTSITTIAGFLSLTIINSHALAQMGVFSSIGIALAGVATWTFLPAILFLTRLPKRESKTQADQDKLIIFLKKTQGKRAFLIFALLMVFFIPGLFKVKTDFNMLEMYKKYTKIRKDSEIIYQVYNISLPVFSVFESKIDPISPTFAKKILEFEENAATSPYILKAYSIYDILKIAYKKLYNLSESKYPENMIKANILYSLVFSQQKDSLGNFINRKEKIVRVLIFPKDLKTSTLNFIEKITKKANGYATGIPYIIKEMNDLIINQQLKTVIFAVSLVFSMLLVIQRSFKITFISIIPILSTLIVLFGFFGYAKIDLSIVTITMASIIMGVGIDYAIHYVALYKHYKNQNKEIAVYKALESASKPILANALGLAFGYTIMNLSPFTIHTYLSEIMWVTMIASSFLSLTLLPSLLKKFD